MLSKITFLLLLSLAVADVKAQSEASVAQPISGLSEATGSLIGGAIGAGSALTVGAVAVTASAAYLTIVSAVAQAESATLAALKIDRELLALAPKRPFARRYLAASLEQLGDLRKRLANYPEALNAYRESLAIRTSLSTEFPQEFAWYRLCALSYSALKDVYVRQNDAKQALAAQTQASAAFARVMELSPSPAALFEWFDSMLFEAELMRSMGQRKQLAAQLVRLTQFAQAHVKEFSTRPDLLAILAQLELTHE